MNRCNLFFLLALFLPLQLFSQIMLLINSEDDGAAVPYAHIFLDGKAYTFSNKYGEFAIDSRQKFDTLKISHLSYETMVLPFNEVKSHTIITLKEKSNMLEEVVVTSKSKKRKRHTLIPERAARGRYDIVLISGSGHTPGRDEFR